MTPQEHIALQKLFNKAWNLAQVQDNQCVVLADLHEDPGEPACRYHHGDLRCFIGASIKKKFYRKKIEGMDVSNGHVLNALKLSGIPLPSIYPDELTDSFVGTISRLQRIHDVRIPKQWERALREFAKRHRLTIPGDSNATT